MWKGKTFMDSMVINIFLTVLTVILFSIYSTIKYFRNKVKRPSYSVIDNVYNSFFDTYFKYTSESGRYLYLDKVYKTMAEEFEKVSISDDEINSYIDFLDKKAGRYFLLPTITALMSFIGINNIESIEKILKVPESILNKLSSIEEFTRNLVNNLGTIILLILIIFAFSIIHKSLYGDNLYQNTRDVWEKTILKDYIDFPKGDKSFDFSKLVQYRKILDFLSCFILNKNKDKIRFKDDKTIIVKKDGQEIKYTEMFAYLGKDLDICYQGETYRIRIELMDDKRSLKIVPDAKEELEFNYLCKVKNYKDKAISQKPYNILFLGWFYKKLDIYEMEGKKLKKKLLFVIFNVVFLIAYIFTVLLAIYGGIILPVVLVFYILSDFLVTKIFAK